MRRAKDHASYRTSTPGRLTLLHSDKRSFKTVSDFVNVRPKLAGEVFLSAPFFTVTGEKLYYGICQSPTPCTHEVKRNNYLLLKNQHSPSSALYCFYDYHLEEQMLSPSNADHFHPSTVKKASTKVSAP